MSNFIAFGDDGSEGADIAWSWIDSQNWGGWSVRVITARPPEDMSNIGRRTPSLDPWEPSNPRVASAESGIAEVTHLFTEVDPREALIEQTDAKLVVVGAKGHGALKALHLGSTAEYLLQLPAAPVVIARRPTEVKKILLCADGSSHSDLAGETLASLPWISSVQVDVVAVGIEGSAPDHAAHRAAEMLSKVGADVATKRLEGAVTRAIVRAAEELIPDLIAMGVRGHSLLKRIIVGSTTSGVVRSTEASVLVAHAQ